MCGIIPYKNINIDELDGLTGQISKITNVLYNRFYTAFGCSGFSGALYWEDNPEFTPEQNKLGASITDLHAAVTLLGGVMHLPIPGAHDFDFKEFKNIKRFSELECSCGTYKNVKP
jgi:hypothetical protein